MVQLTPRFPASLAGCATRLNLSRATEPFFPPSISIFYIGTRVHGRLLSIIETFIIRYKDFFFFTFDSS